MRGIQQRVLRGLAPAQIAGRRAAPSPLVSWEARIRDAFLGMVQGMQRRPEPRHVFDNVASERAWPWRSLCLAMRAAAHAGASRERIVAFADELKQFALALFDGHWHDPDLIAALIAESDAAGAAGPIESRAIAAEAVRGADRAMLEELILSCQIERQRIDDLITAAHARLCGPAMQHPHLHLTPSTP